MATAGYIEAQLGSLPSAMRAVFRGVFDYVLTSFRLGRPTAQRRAENLQLYYLTATTPAIANEEFSIVHGLPRAPYLALPVLALDGLGGGQLVRLGVPRAADATRIYLTSPDVNAPIVLLVEA